MSIHHLLSPSILTSLFFAAAATVTSGCQTVDESDYETDDDEIAYGVRCPQCGLNGLSLAAAAVAPASLTPSELSSFGLLTGNDVVPFCDTSTLAAASCDLEPTWSSWMSVAPERSEILQYLIKSALDHSFTVVDPASGSTFAGMFAMAPSAASAPITNVEQQLITGTFALLTNGVSGIDLCFATGSHDPCPSDYQFLELQAAGNLFSASGRLVVGSPYAPDPQINARTCSGGMSSCPAMEDDLLYNTVGCSYTGPGLRRRATSCTSATTGATWNHPVSAFVIQDPGGYYSGLRPSPIVHY